MRQMEFKMERTGLLEVGQTLPVAEYKLPNSLFLHIGPRLCHVGQLQVHGAAEIREGKVVDVRETPKGYFVTVEFDE